MRDTAPNTFVPPSLWSEPPFSPLVSHNVQRWQTHGFEISVARPPLEIGRVKEKRGVERSGREEWVAVMAV